MSRINLRRQPSQSGRTRRANNAQIRVIEKDEMSMRAAQVPKHKKRSNRGSKKWIMWLYSSKSFLESSRL